MELAIYWSRFQQQYPDHEIFDSVPPEEWQFCVPIKVHGDEGRSILAELVAVFAVGTSFSKLVIIFFVSQCSRQEKTSHHAAQLAAGPGERQVSSQSEHVIALIVDC